MLGRCFRTRGPVEADEADEQSFMASSWLWRGGWAPGPPGSSERPPAHNASPLEEARGEAGGPVLSLDSRKSPALQIHSYLAKCVLAYSTYPLSSCAEWRASRSSDSRIKRGRCRTCRRTPHRRQAAEARTHGRKQEVWPERSHAVEDPATRDLGQTHDFSGFSMRRPSEHLAGRR